ncbi:hypothetical protein ACFSCX_16550 [Bacillus salitolerans]|uniref:Uncharacterized protein n=1 Tax=Bacillus salitolerans TaxID=1437434 RepID=A0ABW4LSJ3_9BACI
MLNRKKFSEKEYKQFSLLLFVISGFSLSGVLVGALLEGIDKSLISPFIVMTTSFCVGILYRTKGKTNNHNEEKNS